jgi:hypothetical protein
LVERNDLEHRWDSAIGSMSADVPAADRKTSFGDFQHDEFGASSIERDPGAWRAIATWTVPEFSGTAVHVEDRSVRREHTRLRRVRVVHIVPFGQTITSLMPQETGIA